MTDEPKAAKARGGKSFLERVVPWPDENTAGHVGLHWSTPRPDGKKFWVGKPFTTFADFTSMLWGFLIPKGEAVDYYFCTSMQRGATTNKKGKASAIRLQSNVASLKSIWIDLDVKDKGYPTKQAAFDALKEFLCSTKLPPPTFIVGSGGGMHVYWTFSRAISLAEWQPVATALKNALIKHGVKCDTGCTVDSVRILRIPGTLNHKTKPPKKVELLGSSPEDYRFEDIAAILAPYAGPSCLPATKSVSAPFAGGSSPWSDIVVPECLRNIDMEKAGEGLEPEKFAPNLNADAVLGGCPFFAHSRETGGADNANPLWNLTTLASVFLPDGGRIAHDLAKGHATYTNEETQQLYERKRREVDERGIRWPSCKAFEAAGCTQCATCPHAGKIKSPLNLGFTIAPTAGPSPDSPPIDGANGNGAVGVSLDDFSAYMPNHQYIFHPTGDPWPGSSVNARLGSVPLCNPDGTPLLDQNGDQKLLPANTWLDQNRPVEQMTWAPGLPMLIPDRLIADGGWIERSEVTCLNLYRPPIIKPGNAAEAERWLDHIRKVFPSDAEHIIKWLAHRRQRPQEKLNHALVLGGGMGIGKDSTLEPVKYAVGPWNFAEVSPLEMLDTYNGFVRSVILRVNEARDLGGELNRFQFYDHMKSYIAAPPDVLRVNEKYLRQHYVLNCCGVVITTNHKADGIYLPPDDRRHFVAWSDLLKEHFPDGYWNRLWGWYEKGGHQDVAAYLAELGIASFDPKAPPPKTAAFWDIVDANRAPEEAELADALDKMKNPDAVTIIDLTIQATGSFADWIKERKNRRAIPHRLEKCGYVPVRNDAKDGLWVISGSRQVVYAKRELSIPDRLKAASNLVHRRAA